ncbi:MAG: hypothetical protein IJL20_03105 [Lachnospiraceae bacterium]|nr:hypothetical protein [Lachnospiraceae bacterium]
MLHKKLNGVWRCMKYRCHSQSPNNHYAIHYRDKGIKVCEEWRNSFRAFYDWAMINGYKEGLVIDRINPEGDYEPDNCQWITASENSKRIKRVSTTKPEGKTKKEKSPYGKGIYGVSQIIYSPRDNGFYRSIFSVKKIIENIRFSDAKRLAKELNENKKPLYIGITEYEYKYDYFPEHGNALRTFSEEHKKHLSEGCKRRYQRQREQQRQNASLPYGQG